MFWGIWHNKRAVAMPSCCSGWVLAGCLSVSCGAYASEAPSVEPEFSTESESSTKSKNSTQALNTPTLEEITVTAQRREQNLQQVPIAISAFDAQTITELSAQGITDLGKYSAGVEMHNESVTQPEYTIRGIHTEDYTVGSEPAVATYIDGVYAARGAGAELMFNDVERVEILKGPQGTLFGRNATGGAIAVMTNAPTFENSGEVTFSLGNYQRRNLNFVYNTPVSDTVAARVSGVINRRNGYLHNLTGPDLNDVDNQGIRLSLLWQPNEQAKIIWRNEYSRLDQNSGAVFTTTESVYSAGSGSNFDVFGDVVEDLTSLEERDTFASTLQVEYQLDRFKLTSITGYRNLNARYLNDEDGSADPQHHFHSDNLDDQDQLSQEFRFTGERGPLNWTLGAVYSREHVDHTTQVEFNHTTFESFALYQAALATPSLVGLTKGSTDLEVAERVNGIRALNQAGLNPALNGTLFPSGFNIDGLILSNFLLSSSFYGNPNNNQLSNILVPASVAPRCGFPAADTNMQAVVNTLGASTAAACAGLPLIQARLNTDTWTETVRNTGTFESAAIYGDFTYALTPRLNLSAGLRYTFDQKDFSVETGYGSNNYFFNDVNGDPLLMGISFYTDGVNQQFVPQHYHDSWGALSGRLVLDYQLQPNHMVYGSITSGFKSGGFNSLNLGSDIDPSFGNESIINYELGLKSDWADGRVRLNMATFYYQYDHKQDLLLTGTPVASYYVVLSDARGQGAELELLWAATERLVLGGNYSYLDTEITKDYSQALTDDRSGQPLANTPPHKINMMAEYTLPIHTNGQAVGELTLHADVNWTDNRLSSNDSKIIESYHLLNVRAAFTNKADQWTLAAWATNLTNEQVLADYTGPASGIGSHTAWRLPPRMYGLDLSYRF